MIRLHSPQEAPRWLQAVLQSIERAFREQRLEESVAADLPPADRNRGKQRLVTDLNSGAGMIAFSNGTNWVRIDTGATL